MAAAGYEALFLLQLKIVAPLVFDVLEAWVLGRLVFPAEAWQDAQTGWVEWRLEVLALRVHDRHLVESLVQTFLLLLGEVWAGKLLGSLAEFQARATPNPCLVDEAGAAALLIGEELQHPSVNH